MRDNTLGDMQSLRAAQGHVLANSGNGIGERIAHCCAAGIMSVFERLDIGDAFFQRHRSNATGQSLKFFIAGNEVGFRIDLDNHTLCIAHESGHKAFSGHTAGLFGSLRQTFLAQPINSGFQIAVRLAQRLFAIHHACASLLAQIFDKGGCNIRHGRFLSSSA